MFLVGSLCAVGTPVTSQGQGGGSLGWMLGEFKLSVDTYKASVP